MEFAQQVGESFRSWLEALSQDRQARLHIVCDSDGDGLPAGALLWRALCAAGYAHTTVECRRKGESAWGPEVAARLEARQRGELGDTRLSAGEAVGSGLDALIVADLGSRDGVILRDAAGKPVPTLLIDHHHPIGQPDGATLITSYGTGDPAGDGKDVATTGLLAYWCARALCGAERASEWLWLCGISLLSDLGDKAPFAELAEAKKRFGGGALRDATSLLNAPRRTANGRADAALELLKKASGPKEVTSGRFAETEELQAAKAEVGEALAVARKQPPRFSKTVKADGADIIMVRIDTGTQVHPLVAMQWRSRFPKAVIFGVNVGYKPGYVHFSGRAPAGVNLLNFLAEHRPPEADTTYGLGHNQASGGALRNDVWNRWVSSLGFGPEMLVEETK